MRSESHLLPESRRVYECGGLRDRMIIPLPNLLHCFIDAIYISCPFDVPFSNMGLYFYCRPKQLFAEMYDVRY